MGIYQKICYTVEDIFVKILSRKQNSVEVKQKVVTYRSSKEESKLQKKHEQQERNKENQRIAAEKLEKEKQEVLAILSDVVDVDKLNYTKYEFQEVKRNKQYFKSLIETVFEPGEKGLTFIQCEFDKTKKQEIKGYLIATSKRVLFLDLGLRNLQKFRYQTIRDINWFKDGTFEKGLYIQYGVKRLEFDEIFDTEQMKRVGNVIKQIAYERSA
ncbi:PH domain-containing protein [Peribacillus simplex]|uniref:YokE-like PH domain-containing protein n=1 Tax=Peribacillus simplex TaxID=1478 RepID=A0AAN2TRM0_9BACI|nr:PH domain-containing protein [Peribacillus simplex]CEG31058.1 hypothetical protein BN1180_01194 [Peribacillus simplex]